MENKEFEKLNKIPLRKVSDFIQNSFKSFLDQLSRKAMAILPVVGIAIVLMKGFSLQMEILDYSDKIHQVEDLRQRLNRFERYDLLNLKRRNFKEIFLLDQDLVKFYSQKKPTSDALAPFKKFLIKRGKIDRFHREVGFLRKHYLTLNDRLSVKIPELATNLNQIKEHLKILENKRSSISAKSYAIGSYIREVRSVQKDLVAKKAPNVFIYEVGRVISRIERSVGKLQRFLTLQLKTSWQINLLKERFRAHRNALIEKNEHFYSKIEEKRRNQLLLLLLSGLIGFIFSLVWPLDLKRKIKELKFQLDHKLNQNSLDKIQSEDAAKEILELLEGQITKKIAITYDDKLVWMGDGFKRLLDLDRTEKNSWRTYLKTNGIVRRIGANTQFLKLKKFPSKDFVLETKRIQARAKFIEITEQTEIERDVQVAKKVKTLGKNFFDLGRELERISSDLGYLFQSTGTQFRFEDSEKIMASIDKKKLEDGLKRVISSLLLYINMSRVKTLMEMGVRETGDAQVEITLKLHKVRILDVDGPLRFNQKEYPSINSYLRKCEAYLSSYDCKIGVRNYFVQNGPSGFAEIKIVMDQTLAFHKRPSQSMEV